MINSIAATGGFMGMCCGPDKSSELRSTRCLFFFFDQHVSMCSAQQGQAVPRQPGHLHHRRPAAAITNAQAALFIAIRQLISPPSC